MTYAESLGLTQTERQNAAYAAQAEIQKAGAHFDAFRGPMNLLPDSVRLSSEYQAHLRQARAAFAEVRAANTEASRAKRRK